jgi:hypothetical protein
MVDLDLERGRRALSSHDAKPMHVVHMHVASEQCLTLPSPTLSLNIRGNLCDNLETGVAK